MSELPPPAPEPANGQPPADDQGSTEAPTPSPQTTAGATDRAGSFGAVFLTTFTTVFLAELGDKT